MAETSTRKRKAVVGRTARKRSSRARRILVIDVGGSHIKVYGSGMRNRRSAKSGRHTSAAQMIKHVLALIGDRRFDAASIGYPGPVLHGKPLAEPRNLGTGWVGYNYKRALGIPVRMVNDAVMQAIADYTGGRLLFLGLGTGLGTVLIVNGVVEPMEIGHLPYRKGRSYEDYLGERGLTRLGKRRWRRALKDVVRHLSAALEVDRVVLGGGNARHAGRMPRIVRISDNLSAERGGFLLWTDSRWSSLGGGARN
jgi:polyphosphate glucokinase